MTEYFEGDPNNKTGEKDTVLYKSSSLILQGENIPAREFRTSDIKIREGCGGLMCALYSAVGFRSENDDRLLWMMEEAENTTILGAIDGFQKFGGEYAETLAKYMKDYEGNIQLAMREVIKEQRKKISALIADFEEKCATGSLDEMDKSERRRTILSHAKSGCCCAFAIIKQKSDHKWTIGALNLGDSRIITINGNAVIPTPEHSIAQEENLGDAVHYDNKRHIVTNSLSHNTPPLLDTNNDEQELSPGTWVLAYSDGIGHNLTPEEIAVEIKDCHCPKEASEKILRIVYERMARHDEYGTDEALANRKKEGKYPDGYLGKPVKDNITLAITRIPPSSDTVTTR